MTKEVPRTSVLRDEELSISDATLIAQLREYREINEGSTGVSYDPIPECLAAADRIELLATTNEQLVATNEALSISNATLIDERDQNWDSFVHWRKQVDDLTGQLAAARDDAKEAEAYAEELEAKLAKAVEALEAFKEFDDLPTAVKRPDLFELKVRKPILRTLAEIKGESHE